MKLSLIVFILLFIVNPAQAQQKLVFPDSTTKNKLQLQNACGTDGMLKELRKDPLFKKREESKNREILLSPSPPPDEILVIPVVVHIINDSPNTITNQMVQDGIKDLNDAFAKTGVYSSSGGVDTRITFCLARTDPDGGITNGITRMQHFYGQDHNMTLEQSRLKNLIQWDPAHYANIWLIANIEDEMMAWFNCGSPGAQWNRMRPGAYATMPPGGGPLDGIVVPSFGTVLAHEMGHYLGLYHTFEGGCNNYNCETSGDMVCDTPPDNSLGGGCGAVGNSCITDSIGVNPGYTTDQHDRPANFMDYIGCRNEFTQGQADRMRKAIANSRSGLLLNKCDPPCADNISALFSRNNPYPVAGNTVNFTNQATGAASYQWLVNDIPVATSANFSRLFSTVGKTKITLKAYNNIGCFASYTDYVTVTCGLVAARFWVDKKEIASLAGLYTDSILFTNTSEHAISCQWLIGNDVGMAEQVVSTTTGNLLYTFPSPGNYTVRLVATNGACSDTTDIYRIPVYNPTPDGILSVYRADCYEQTKVRVQFSICNMGYMPLPKGMLVSFYDADPKSGNAKKLEPSFELPYGIGGTIGGYCCWSFNHIVDAGRPHLNQLYMVLNDSGKAVPVNLPNTTVVESNYNNNFASIFNFRYSVTATPPGVTLAPEDTFALSASTQPYYASSSFNWSPGYNLSCASCATTSVYADTTTIKQVIATSSYGCKDTAYIDVQVPPAYDFRISLQDAQCTANDDSLYVNFSLFNDFKRDILPRGLKVAFYKGNPATGTATLLPPIFSVPATTRQPPYEFSTYIKGMAEGQLFAVVNDDGSTVPLKLPNDTTIKEIDYTNNLASFTYKRLTATAANNGPVCERDTLELSASSITGASFAWTGPENFNSSNQNASRANVIAAHSGNYTVTASKYGCTSLPAATAAIVYAAPVLTVGHSSPVCETRPVRLSANSTNGNTYTWSGPDGFSSLSQSPSISNTLTANNGIYTVIATSGNGCISMPATVSLTVNPLPEPGFSDTISCLPATTAFFQNQSTISSGNINSYTWDFGEPASGASNSSSGVNPSHTYARAGSYTVSLTAVSDSGCAVTANKTYSRFHPKPTAAFTLNPSNGVCVNEALLLTDNSNGADGNIVRWKWQTGDGTAAIENNVPLPVSHAYAKEGNYTISLQILNNFGCGDTAENPVTVYPLPMVDAGPTQYVLQGNSTTLKPTASGNSLTYLWTPASFLSNANSFSPAVVRPLDDVVYMLTVTSQDGCQASDATLVKILRPIKIPNAFSPNGDGINDVWNVTYLNDYPNCTVEIFDRYGRIVFKTVGYNRPWDGKRDGNPVPVGVYYYIIDPKNGAAKATGSLTVLR